MRRNRHALRGTAFIVLVALAGAPSCATTTESPVAYDHFTIVNEGPVPVHDVRFLVADGTGAIFDEGLLRGGAPIHPGETVTWIRPRLGSQPPLEMVRCELLFDGPDGPMEVSGSADTDPWGPPNLVNFRFRPNPDVPEEYGIFVD